MSAGDKRDTTFGAPRGAQPPQSTAGDEQ
ncbi:hypothetical protein I5H55_gp71 [Mycobacterium phage Krakatau]|uniref:Uncharacterized protein n=1 Tax=Mycobacterium phage Krakatau TaxID=2283296 RepID=A0A345MH40_9CAUD|nr:hypothetical protein I5H55_gp71 [Mycobacterium phage Krakatau]AXH69871.1 hypothetical protein SEA_KRAKATAU_71 [Mycobacterium phage Krakatau]